jgi:hypothetical protein
MGAPEDEERDGSDDAAEAATDDAVAPEEPEEPEEPKKAAPKAAAADAAGPKKAAPAKGGGWLDPESWRRRLVIALGIYALCTAVFAAVAGPQRMGEHTAFNHYAHLADAWLHGRQDLRNGEPPYAGGNDFAHYDGKVYISFPPFPAMLMVPFVALAGSPENFRDGQFLVWLAGVGPAALFLALEKLRRTKRSRRSEWENAFLALLFAFGTVYFFTAVEGTVWFAAHVVAVGLLSLYALWALDAERPLLAGIAVACLFLSRPQCLLTSVLFGLEAIRVSCKDGVVTEGSFVDRVTRTWDRVDKGAFFRRVAIFSAPILCALALASWMNSSRFGNPNPTAFGHEHLSVVWQGRIGKWGLFGYHYLAKNLGVALTILPFLPPKGVSGPGVPPFQINEHGLALWFTTPLYFWLLWPRRKGWLHGVLWLAALGPIVFDLLYQNSGWRQFGYRFSNDYAPLLFLLLAIGGRPMGRLWQLAAAWALAWNLFGAITFDRLDFDRFYWRDGTQRILYQDD